MRKVMKVAVVGSLIASSALYASSSTKGCVGCHGANFEKHAMGKSKVVKNMSHADIVAALKGYKAGTYGGAMKGIMKGQVTSMSDADMEAIADTITNGSKAPAEFAKDAKADVKKVININEGVDDPNLLSKEDLGNKKVVDETVLGLRKKTLFEEDVAPADVKYDRPAPGTAPRFERAYVNAPPMIPHSVEGLLPITKDNNQCLGCHMPDVAKGVGATPIPASHFTNYRPTTVMKGDKVVKEGKVLGQNNTSDVLIAKAKKLNHLYQGRFNCSQCHAPQADVKPIVGNTFKPDGLTGDLKSGSNLVDVIDEGVK